MSEIKKIKNFNSRYSLQSVKMENSFNNSFNNVHLENIDLEDIEEKRYEIDQNGNVTLLEVNTDLAEKMDLLVDKCKEAGLNVKITESIRSVTRQDELYAQGRTKGEKIFTNAKGSDYSSMHQWGIAFDVCINDVNDAYNIEKLKQVGEIGKSIGLEWGGDWEKFPDMPHFQLVGYSIEELKDIYGNPGEFSETWN